MQGSLPVLLTIEIVDYEKKGQAVYYYIEILANNSKKWKLERRYKDMEEMHKKLAKKLDEIPYLPAKSFFQITGDALEKRKDDLEKYFNIIASRADVLMDADFKEFLEIEKHVKLDNLTKVKKISEIQNLPRAVRDFIYVPQKGVLIILLAEINTLTKLGTMITNFSKVKGKEELSSVVLYREEPLNSLEFTRIWKKSFDDEATSMCLDQTSPYLAVGFSNGLINCLKLTAQDRYETQQEYCKIHCHNNTITGMIVLPDSGHLLSISTDKHLLKTDVDQNDGKISDKPHSHPLTSILYDNSNKRVFIGDIIGSIFIYDPHNKMELLHAIHFPKENLIKVMFFDPLRNMLLSGSTQGVITIYQIGKSGKEKFSSITGTFDTLKNIRSIYFSAEAKEIYVASGNGNIAFVNTLTTAALHVYEAHSDSLSKMVYLDGKKLLITGGGDKTIRFWRYPYDPKEKLTQKVIDHTGTVIASSDPAQQYQVQKRQEAKENINKGEKYAKPDDDDDNDKDSSPREALNLMKYQPAKEVNIDEYEDDDDRDVKKSKPQIKKPDDMKKSDKTNKPAVNKVDDDDESNERSDDVFPKKKQDREASPKSFLFKNSIDSNTKKPDVPQATKKQEEKKEALQTKEEVSKKPKEDTQSSPPVVKKNPAKVQNKDDDDEDEVKEVRFEKPEKKMKKKTPAETKQKEKVEVVGSLKDAPIKPSTNIKAESKADNAVDDDKPLDFETLKKSSNYVPLTFKKKAGDSDDEELSGWTS